MTFINCPKNVLFTISATLSFLLNSPYASSNDTATSTNSWGNNQARIEVTESTPQAMEFPRTVMLPEGMLTVYEPQIEKHEGFTEITARSAAVFSGKQGQPVFGSIKFSADIVVDKENRLVTVFNRDILEVSFKTLDSQQSEQLISVINSTINNEPETIPLDVVLGYLVDDAVTEKSVEVSFTPPEILYANKPTLLVVIDGDPIKIGVKGQEDLSYVVNTNWDLFYSEASGAYSLLLGNSWLTATSLDGTWTQANAPDGISALPDEERWSAAKAAVPGGSIPTNELPNILVAQAPAELIVTKGPVELDPIPGTRLSFVANTSSDIVLNDDDKFYYFLTSGRWFKAQSLDGNWSGVESLPAEFQSIPAGHPRGHVRVSVPGTEEAKLAVIQAQIPQTAEVSRTVEAPVVVYADGEPEFKKIEGIDVYRVSNSTFDVFRVDGKYYLCHDAVWFVANGPNGTWRVTDMIPAQIYQIPASSPAHHVTYVQVYDSTPDTIYFGYTSGYHYSYINSGVVVYGSGYYWGAYYNPYHYAYYPSYYYVSYPYTYGQASIYQANTGTFVHGHYAYGPYGGYGQRARYNSNTGRYGSSAYAYDYDTSVYEGWSYNPRTDISTNSSQAIQWSDSNSYESWGETVIQRDDKWVQSERYATESGYKRDVQSSNGGQAMQVGDYKNRATVAQTSSGDLYAGANGNVYRRTDDGQWETNNNGEWASVNTPETNSNIQAKANGRKFDTSSTVHKSQLQGFNIQQLERDRAARSVGRSNYEKFKANRSGGFSRGRAGGRSFEGRRR